MRKDQDEWNEYQRSAARLYRWRKWAWLVGTIVLFAGIALALLTLGGCNSPLGPTETETTAAQMESKAAADEFGAALKMAPGPDRESALIKAQARVQAALAALADLEKRANAAEKLAESAQAAANTAGAIAAPTGIGGAIGLAGWLFSWWQKRRMARAAMQIAAGFEYVKEHVPDALYNQMMDKVRADQATCGELPVIQTIVRQIPPAVRDSAKLAGKVALEALEEAAGESPTAAAA